MKVIVSLLMTFMSCMGLYAQSVTEYFDAGNPIKFCGTEFYLKWSSHPQDNYYVQEYFPKDEAPEHFNQMIGINILFCDATAKDMAGMKMAELEQRKQTDPVVNYNLFEKGDEFMLEFCVSQSNEKGLTVFENNLYRFKQMKLDGKNAVVLYFFAGRAYVDDILPYIQSIPEKRTAWYKDMIEMKIDPKLLKN